MRPFRSSSFLWGASQFLSLLKFLADNRAGAFRGRFLTDWIMNVITFKSFNDDFFRAALHDLKKAQNSVVNWKLLSMLYRQEIQIKAREKWLEAKQSIKCLEYLKYFEVYGRTRQVFLLFS